MVTFRQALLVLLLAAATAPAASAASAAAAGSAGSDTVEPKAAAVRAFERGARELEFGRYDEAAREFAAAIALDPVESGQPVARPSGMNFEPYLPHLALGVARCESDDLTAASASWAESDRQAAARASRGAARLLLRRAQCTERHREGLRAAEGARALSVPPAGETESGAPTPIVSPASEAEVLSVTPAAASDIEPHDVLSAPPPPAVADSPPVELLRAAQELFDGRPELAYEILEHFASKRSQARGQAHLLRAAACFDLARIEPVSGDWLVRARAERTAARLSAPALVPDRRFFAPAFVEFFTLGTEPAPAGELLAH